jgi:hypothetical protein
MLLLSSKSGAGYAPAFRGKDADQASVIAYGLENVAPRPEELTTTIKGYP